MNDLCTDMDKTSYELVVGLEVHAELMTQSKMFCGCRVVDSVTAQPNTAVCSVCLGMPGMLPVINEQAIVFALRVALALNCTIHPHNVFARKSYFYPDLPKGYQISQYEQPLATQGWLEIMGEDGNPKRIGIRRVHLEEDTGKNSHLPDGSSLVDYNRSGVPLLEIVSEPDLHSPEELFAYGVALRQILRYLGVNSGDMEKGVLRIEPNISVRRLGSTEFGIRTEVKNLNSFRALVGAAAYEFERQVKILTTGGAVVQETRGWDEGKRVTFSQRAKEEAEDYRYFPEPDLPALSLSPSFIQSAATQLPELPADKCQRYIHNWGLSSYDAQLLTDERLVAEWFEQAVAQGGNPKQVANWMNNQLFSLMNEHKREITALNFAPQQLVELLSWLEQQRINQTSAKEVLVEMFHTGQSPQAIILAKGLEQISDIETIEKVVKQVLAENRKEVDAWRAGKTSLRAWFVGQIMKKLHGKANPALVNRVLDEQLKI